MTEQFSLTWSHLNADAPRNTPTSSMIQLSPWSRIIWSTSSLPPPSSETGYENTLSRTILFGHCVASELFLKESKSVNVSLPDIWSCVNNSLWFYWFTARGLNRHGLTRANKTVRALSHLNINSSSRLTHSQSWTKQSSFRSQIFKGVARGYLGRYKN